MFSNFPLWTLHLYEVTFPQHLHMEYISLCWSDIPEIVVPIRISFIESCCQVSYWTNASHWLSWSRHFERFTVANITCLTVTEYLCHRCPRICSVCLMHFPVHNSFVTYHRVVIWSTQRVALVEQELLTIPEYLNSYPVNSGVPVARSYVFCVLF